jgi:hypothetical protein
VQRVSDQIAEAIIVHGQASEKAAKVSGRSVRQVDCHPGASTTTHTSCPAARSNA